MLVGRGVEDYLRSPFAEDIVQTGWQADITDDRRELELREFFFEFEADVVHRGLCIVEEDEFLDSETCKLAAEFGSDGSCCSCDEDGLAAEVLDDFVHGDLDFLTHQEVFDLDVTDVVYRLSVHHLVHRRGEEELDAIVDGVSDDAVFLLAGLFFCGEEDGLGSGSCNHALELFFGADIVDFLFGDDMGGMYVSELDEAHDVMSG